MDEIKNLRSDKISEKNVNKYVNFLNFFLQYINFFLANGRDVSDF